MISCADYALKHALLELNGTCMVQICTQHTYIFTCAHNRLLRALNDRLTNCAAHNYVHLWTPKILQQKIVNICIIGRLEMAVISCTFVS